jgi:hypothetical protein
LQEKEASTWKPSPWTDATLGGLPAMQRHLVSTKDGEPEWKMYVQHRGKMYHAILLNAPSAAMELNRGFYDGIVATFEGISQ